MLDKNRSVSVEMFLGKGDKPLIFLPGWFGDGAKKHPRTHPSKNRSEASQAVENGMSVKLLVSFDRGKFIAFQPMSIVLGGGSEPFKWITKRLPSTSISFPSFNL